MRLDRRLLSRRQRHRPRTLSRFGRWLFCFLAGMLGLLAPIPLLIFHDAVLVEIHLTDHSNETTKRILMMGWVSSLQELNENWILEKEMEEFCSSYNPTRPRGYGYHEGHEGGMHVHIFYNGEEDESSRHEIQAVLSQQGCSASFTHEQSIDHVKDIAKRRSYERELVLQDNIHYDAVVNLDLDDIISLPSLSSFQHALSHAISDPGAVICANEQRTWYLLFRQLLRGRQHGSATMGQLPQHASSFQSTDFCSEGFAMYSWKAWSSIHCNFDTNSESDRDAEDQPLLRSSKDQGAHANFQECLKDWNDETWIGVQPDLIIWRKLWWCPWVTLLAFVVVGTLAWDQIMSLISPRRSGLTTLFWNCPKGSNKRR